MIDTLGFRFTGKGIVNRIDTYTPKNGGRGIVSIILEVPDDKYPQHIAFKLFGKLADIGRDAKKGSVVEIVGRLGGRDWNGKVFDEAVAESLEVVGEPAQGALPGTEQPKTDSDVPF